MDISEKLEKRKRILVLGGHGYGNVGDEAQLSANIEMLKKEFPKSLIKVLTPNESYTYSEHKGCLVGDAPRVAFYDLGKSKLYGIRNTNKTSLVHFVGNELFKIRFILRSYWIMINAYLMKHKLPPFLIGAKRVALLHEIQKSDMVFFSGGGYLTGKTLSRLWDGMFFIRISNIFEVPVYLSGQTIGVWGNSLNKKIAKSGLKHAKLITCRDPEDSIKALSEIGINSNRYFVTCDDALYCEKVSDTNILNAFLADSGINTGREYITMNVHYWGINNSDGQKELLEKINNIIEKINSLSNVQILLIPMTPLDEMTINDYLKNYNKSNVFGLKYNYDFRVVRGIISKRKGCITMKHHPIIFALGEGVPVISMSLSDYYEHKNIGALKLFNLGEYNVKLEDQKYQESFERLYRQVLTNYEDIKKNINEGHMNIELTIKKFRESLHA